MTSSEANVVKGSEDHQKPENWKFQKWLNVVIIRPIIVEE